MSLTNTNQSCDTCQDNSQGTSGTASSQVEKSEQNGASRFAQSGSANEGLGWHSEHRGGRLVREWCSRRAGLGCLGQKCEHSEYCEHRDHCRRGGLGGRIGHKCRSLAELRQGEMAKIDCVLGNQASVRRIMALGFSPGAEVSLVRRAPLGDPLEFELSGCLLTLREEEAHKVMIEVEDIA